MIEVLVGDCLETLKTLPEQSVHTCVTSPPYYGLRDYGNENQIGLEQTPDEYIAKLVSVFSEVKRVLRDDGTLWVNIGDSYYNYRPGKGQSLTKQSVAKTNQDLPNTCARRANKFNGVKEKDLIGIPWMLAFALRADGWYLRQDIIWQKPNPMPESVKDRCTKAHEYIFLLSKSPKYYFDNKAIEEDAVGGPSTTPVINEENRKTLRTDIESRHRSKIPGGQSLCSEPRDKKNRRSVWNVATKPYRGAHFATFPPDLIEPCILAGAPEGGVVLDPFGGSGTTAGVAVRNNRKAILCELNESYTHLIPDRVKALSGYDMPHPLDDLI